MPCQVSWHGTWPALCKNGPSTLCNPHNVIHHCPKRFYPKCRINNSRWAARRSARNSGCFRAIRAAVANGDGAAFRLPRFSSQKPATKNARGCSTERLRHAVAKMSASSNLPDRVPHTASPQIRPGARHCGLWKRHNYWIEVNVSWTQVQLICVCCINDRTGTAPVSYPTVTQVRYRGNGKMQSRVGAGNRGCCKRQ